MEGLNHYLNEQNLTTMSKDVYRINSVAAEVICEWIKLIN